MQPLFRPERTSASAPPPSLSPGLEGRRQTTWMRLPASGFQTLRLLSAAFLGSPLPPQGEASPEAERYGFCAQVLTAPGSTACTQTVQCCAMLCKPCRRATAVATVALSWTQACRATQRWKSRVALTASMSGCNRCSLPPKGLANNQNLRRKWQKKIAGKTEHSQVSLTIRQDRIRPLHVFFQAASQKPEAELQGKTSHFRLSSETSALSACRATTLTDDRQLSCCSPHPRRL